MIFWPLIAAACPELGTDPVRLYEGVAPHEETFPYATFQYVRTTPINNLHGSAYDEMTLQFDVWARTPTESRQIADKIRATLNTSGYMVFYESSREEDLARTTIQFQFIQ